MWEYNTMQHQTWEPVSFNRCISDLLPSISSVLPFPFQTLTIVLKSGKKAWCFRHFQPLIPSHSETIVVYCALYIVFLFDEEYTFLLSVDYGFNSFSWFSILGLCWQFGVWTWFINFFFFFFRFDYCKHFGFCPFESSYCTK